MKKILRTFSVVLLLLIPQLLFASQKCGEVVRGVFDVGSGSTKIKVNVIDTCIQKITKELIQNDKDNKNSRKVDYFASLKVNNKTFSDQVISDGIKAIQELKTYAETNSVVTNELQLLNQKNVQWRGIATSAFRTATNGVETLEKFSREIKYRFKKIDEDEETRLGRVIGVSIAKNPSKTTVWDIGSGSQQISYNQDGQVKFVKLENKASADAKNAIIESQAKDPKVTTSPNPIGDYSMSVAAIENMLGDAQLPKKKKGVEVIGIGGVHQASITKATGKTDEYTISDVSNAITKFIEMDDKAINDKYADTFVSNLILVETMMQKMRIEKVHVCKYSIADGYMLQNEDWKSVNDKIIDDIFNTSKDPKGSLYKDLNQTDKDKVDEIFEPL